MAGNRAQADRGRVREKVSEEEIVIRRKIKQAEMPYKVSFTSEQETLEKTKKNVKKRYNEDASREFCGHLMNACKKYKKDLELNNVEKKILENREKYEEGKKARELQIREKFQEWKA